MYRLKFFVALNWPWQLIKTLKTKLWLRRLVQLTVGRWWIVMSHLARVFPCDFAFIFKLYMYKEAITGGFICSWQNLLWMTKSRRYSILSFIKTESCCKLKLLKILQVLLTVPAVIFSDITSSRLKGEGKCCILLDFIYASYILKNMHGDRKLLSFYWLWMMHKFRKL